MKWILHEPISTCSVTINSCNRQTTSYDKSRTLQYNCNVLLKISTKTRIIYLPFSRSTITAFCSVGCIFAASLPSEITVLISGFNSIVESDRASQSTALETGTNDAKSPPSSSPSLSRGNKSASAQDSCIVSKPFVQYRCNRERTATRWRNCATVPCDAKSARLLQIVTALIYRSNGRISSVAQTNNLYRSIHLHYWVNTSVILVHYQQISNMENSHKTKFSGSRKSYLKLLLNQLENITDYVVT